MAATGKGAFLSLALWLGVFHFVVALVAAAVVLLPFRPALGLSIFGVLVIFTLIPINSKSEWGRKLSRYVWKSARGYFPATLHVEDMKAFDPNKAYLFGYEPHSVFPVGICALMDETGPMPLRKIKVFGSTAVFCLPFVRHIWTWLGYVSVVRKSFYKYLGSGHSCILMPGGMQEMLYLDNDIEIIFLKKRKGFVRIAIEMGIPLVPVFTFGQREAFKWWKPEGKLFARISKALKLTPVIFWGAYKSPVPYRNPNHVVVGKPIELQRNPQPTTEQVDEVHGQFVSAIEELFEKNKTRFGYPNLQLKIL